MVETVGQHLQTAAQALQQQRRNLAPPVSNTQITDPAISGGLAPSAKSRWLCLSLSPELGDTSARHQPAPPHNLLLPLMALVGREREVAAVTDLPYRDAEAARLSRSLGGFLIGIAILLTWADMLGIPMLPVHSHG